MYNTGAVFSFVSISELQSVIDLDSVSHAW